MPLHHRIATAFAVALPWLHPWAPGPSPQVVPWLVSLACMVVVAWQALTWPAQASPQRVQGDSRPAVLDEAIAWGWAIAGLVSALIGLVQYLGWSERLPSALAWLVSLPRPGEAVGNLRQPNQFATHMVIGSLALAWLWCAGRIAPGGGRRLAVVAGIGLMALANVASGSRTGLVLHVGAALIAAAWAWRRRTTPLTGQREPVVRCVVDLATWALVAYAAGLLIAPGIQAWQAWQGGMDHGVATAAQRLVDGAQDCSSRLTLWSNVIDLVVRSPWVGYGIGGLDRAHYEGVFEHRFCDILDHAHNLPLHLAVELGLPAAVLACSAALWWVLRRRPWRPNGAASVLAWAVLAVIGAHSMVEHPLWHGPFALAALCAVIIIERGQPRLHARRRGGAGNYRVVVSAAALFAGMALAYVGYDYHRASQLYLSPLERDAAFRHDTLAQARRTCLFGGMVEFAQLTTTQVQPDNARATHARALALLSYSPEPRVIEKLLESASMLGLQDEVRWHEARYAAAFAQAHAQWRAQRRATLQESGQTQPPPGPQGPSPGQ